MGKVLVCDFNFSGSTELGSVTSLTFATKRAEEDAGSSFLGKLSPGNRPQTVAGQLAAGAGLGICSPSECIEVLLNVIHYCQLLLTSEKKSDLY